MDLARDTFEPNVCPRASCAEICCAFNTSKEAKAARTGREYFRLSHVSQGPHRLQLLRGDKPGRLVAHEQFSSLQHPAVIQTHTWSSSRELFSIRQVP